MRTLSEKILATLCNNPLGRWYLGVPKGKKIYKITRSSAHYYTGDLAKNGMPVICTGDTRPSGRNPFIYWLETWKPIHLCWLFIAMGWKIPKYFIGLDTGAKAPTTTGVTYGNDWTNPTNAYVTDGVFATGVDNGALNQAYGSYGLNVTAGATINGIEVILIAKASTAGQMRFSVRSYTQGFKVKDQDLTTTLTTYTLGSSSDLWGAVDWTATHFSDANFPTKISLLSSTGYTFSVDSITVKVYYTESSTAIKTINGLANASVKTVNGLARASVKTWDGLA